MSLTNDPAWPIPVLALVAVAVVALTVWTYHGVPGARFGRVATVLGLRLLALVLAFLALLRPSVAFPEGYRNPSLLVIALDDSESMTIQDEPSGQARWNVLLAALRDAEPELQRLRDRHNVQVVFHRFAADVRDFDPESPGKAEGKRSDYGELLNRLFERYRAERRLRALIVLGDGADNGTRHDAQALAVQWRHLPCPLHAFAFGKPTTTDRQNDIAVTGLVVEPSPIPARGEMTVRATIDAHGFETAAVRVKVLLDGKEAARQDVKLALTAGNEVKLKCAAPEKPGEVKVTVKVTSPDDQDALPGETTAANNEMSTFATVTVEGVNVLIVDRARLGEPQAIYDALKQDGRFRPAMIQFRQVALPPAGAADLFHFDRQRWDVIILGDVSAARVARSGGPDALGTIKRLVGEKGAGLMMIGGRQSFAGSDWKDTPVAEVLPVKLAAAPGQVEDEVKMVPTEAGLRHYLLRLSDDPAKNKQVWDSLPPLDGCTQMGDKKDLATVLAQAPDGTPLLVGQQYGKGRVLAFAGDTTVRWKRPPDGDQHFGRFWRQAVLWLAQQEDMAGGVWVRPDARRVPAGGKLGFAVGARGKGGVDLADARFQVTVIGPDKVETPVPTAREGGQERGLFWKTDVPGEYRVVVKGEAKDGNDTVAGEPSARFIVYETEAEMARRAADHDFLKRLAGEPTHFHRGGEELKGLLRELATQPLPGARQKADQWPDWRRGTLSPFLPAFLAVFVALLSLEWFLRRRWGLA